MVKGPTWNLMGSALYLILSYSLLVRVPSLLLQSDGSPVRRETVMVRIGKVPSFSMVKTNQSHVSSIVPV